MSMTRVEQRETIRTTLGRKHIALPAQHGAWAMWLGPFAVGVAVGGRPGWALLWLTLAMTGAFLLLQPLTILVKVLAGRRPAEERTPALVWTAIYSALAAAGALGLALAGAGHVFWLALPAGPVLAWQLWLVARRAERGQKWAEILGAGVLALSAPAAQAVAAGGLSRLSLMLWLLCAWQAAGAIEYIYLALNYRRMKSAPPASERWRLARGALAWQAAQLLGTAGLALAGWVPPLAPVAVVFMLAEVVYGSLLRPAVGVKPVVIGVRQTIVTALFSLLLIWAYHT